MICERNLLYLSSAFGLTSSEALIVGCHFSFSNWISRFTH